jgi:hypothetical protein
MRRFVEPTEELLEDMGKPTPLEAGAPWWRRFLRALFHRHDSTAMWAKDKRELLEELKQVSK